MKNKKKFFGAILAAGLVFIGVTSYFAGTEVMGTLTSKKVKVTVTETDFGDANKTGDNTNVYKQKIHPRIIFQKDPRVGLQEKSRDAYVFMKIEVPYISSEVVSMPDFGVDFNYEDENYNFITLRNDADGETADLFTLLKNGKAIVDCVDYTDKTSPVVSDGYIGDGWYRIKDHGLEENGKHIYVFAYGNENGMTELSGGEQTEQLLFDEFQFVDIKPEAITDGYLQENAILHLGIYGYAIQSDGLFDDNATPEEIWALAKESGAVYQLLE